MSAARSRLPGPSHDGGETSHTTPVIPLRVAATPLPAQTPPEPMPVARRRAEALRLSREEGLSLREIGDRLGVGKDTVSRDIKAAERDENRDSREPSQETPRDAGETPPAPSDGGHDTLVLVLDEPLRQALAVLRATAAGADTPEQNAKAARSAIFAVADTITELQKHQEGRP